MVAVEVIAYGCRHPGGPGGASTPRGLAKTTGGPDMANITFTHPALVALDGRLTITIDEAAKILGLGRSAAYEAVRRGQIPSRRLVRTS